MKKFLFFLFSSLIVSFNYAQPTLFGMLNAGGDGNGVIFGMPTGSTNISIQKNIPTDNPGFQPERSHLIEAGNGKLYGMTYGGGACGIGTLFEYNPSNNLFTKKIDFEGFANGSWPIGSLVLASNGKLYGMTYQGGVNNFGVLFEYDIITNTLTKKIDFDGISNGKLPRGSLIQANNGKLYGMTANGGVNNFGILFEYDTNTGISNKLLDFLGASNGSFPQGDLLQFTNGKLYGMTYGGGLNNFGVLFEYDPSSNIYTKKIDFAGATNGKFPNGGLMLSTTGKIYGMTYQGGVNDFGVLFEYVESTNVITKKIDFSGTANGKNPLGDLIEASNGKLYGMTSSGGNNDLGVLFEYELGVNTITKKIDFAGSTNGQRPRGSLIQANNGKLYGMTSGGGVNYSGVLFEYETSTNIFNKKIEFASITSGRSPNGSLTHVNQGKFYGMTSGGGIYDFGVLFEYDVNTNTYVKKVDFAGTTNGRNPQGTTLLLANNGKLYGGTILGGVNGLGVLFEYNPSTNVYTKKKDLNTTNGFDFRGSLIQASNGKLYGMTHQGGANNVGVLFEYDINTNVYTKKIDFNITMNGQFPYGSLMQASNGKLYGLTYLGGVNNLGVLFEYDINSNICTKKIDFAGTLNGSRPLGDLTQANNGKLYGITQEGGVNNFGVLFEYDISTNSCTKKMDFDDTQNGKNPMGSLMEASNGKLYGMTSQGGVNNFGVLFEYDKDNNIFTKKMDFNLINGGGPSFTNLIETCATFAPSGQNSQFFCQTANPTISDINVIGSNIQWYTAPIGTSTLLPSSTLMNGTHYYASQTIDGCESGLRLDVMVTINPPPTITINSGTICSGESFTLIPSGANTYTYSSGSDIVSPTTNTTYTVIGADINGCISSNTTLSSLTVNFSPIVIATTNNSLICVGETASLTVSGADTYAWSTTENTSVIAVSPTITSIYTVTGTSMNGCASTSTITQDVSLCTSINTRNERNDFDLIIYPNPNNGIFNIELGTVYEKDVSIQIFNSFAQVIMTKKIIEKQTVLNLNYLFEGIYFVKVLAEQTHSIKKILINK